MAHSMKQLLLKRTFLTACFMGTTWSAALADEGSLILPVQAGGNLELMLEDNLDHDPSYALQLFVGDPDGCCTGKMPVAGRYTVEEQSVIFNPAFDLVEGQVYTVLSRDRATERTAFTIQAGHDLVPPSVVAIYPSGFEIPENTLRFYIQFSTPMRPHVSTDFISLVDVNGTPDTAAFMTFKQELWNEDRTHLTLLMDPGRIKRGVATNVAFGPALLAGNRYAIRIADGWQAAGSEQEAPGFAHSFTVSVALRVLPDTGLWQFQEPRISTQDPLLITFDRPFDEQMAQRAITVVNADGQPIHGAISVENAEQTWRFIPQDIWATQTLQIVVDANLEDVAGNNLKELLDHAVDVEARTIDQQTVALTLRPAPD
jgi:hypothetical protein